MRRASSGPRRKAAGDRPFRRLISTHHHGDHVNGNQFFAPIEIFSHPYCRDEVRKAVATTPKQWDKREGYADGTEQRQLVPPTTTIEGKMVFHYGDSPVEIIHPGPAHTYGDLMIYLPKYRLLFASDIAFIYVAPFAHNAHVGKWLETIDRIMKMDVDTIVPGHGPIGGKKELAEMAGYFRLAAARSEAALRCWHVAGPRRRRHQAREVRQLDRSRTDRHEYRAPVQRVPRRRRRRLRLGRDAKGDREYNAILASRGIKG